MQTHTLIFQVRPAHPSDSYGFDPIFQELNWFEPMGSPVSDQSEVAFDIKNRYHEQITAALDTGYRSFFVAETSNANLIGYAAAYWLPQCNAAHPQGYLTDLFVLAQHRELTVGQALLDSIVTESQSRGCKELFMRHSHTASQHEMFGNRDWEENLNEGIYTLHI